MKTVFAIIAGLLLNGGASAQSNRLPTEDERVDCQRYNVSAVLSSNTRSDIDIFCVEKTSDSTLTVRFRGTYSDIYSTPYIGVSERALARLRRLVTGKTYTCRFPKLALQCHDNLDCGYPHVAYWFQDVDCREF